FASTPLVACYDILGCHFYLCFFFSSRRRHTRWPRDWSSDVCSSDLVRVGQMRGPIKNHLGRNALSRFPLSFQRLNRLLQPAEIGVESDRLRMPRLLPPEQVPCAPQLEVAQRDPVARSEIGVVLEHAQPLLGFGIEV